MMHRKYVEQKVAQNEWSNDVLKGQSEKDRSLYLRLCLSEKTQDNMLNKKSPKLNDQTMYLKTRAKIVEHSWTLDFVWGKWPKMMPG